VQKSLAFAAIVSAGLIADMALAANTAAQCDHERICLNSAALGRATIQRDPNLVIAQTKLPQRSIGIQTGPNAVVTTPPVIPLGPNGRPGGNPCTVHCGPLGGKKK
jgi:hypothetical protein